MVSLVKIVDMKNDLIFSHSWVAIEKYYLLKKIESSAKQFLSVCLGTVEIITEGKWTASNDRLCQLAI